MNWENIFAFLALFEVQKPFVSSFDFISLRVSANLETPNQFEIALHFNFVFIVGQQRVSFLS